MNDDYLSLVNKLSHEKFPDDELEFYVPDKDINLDSRMNKLGEVLDILSESDLVHFQSDFNRSILNQLQYQYCKDLNIPIIIHK